VEKGITGRVCVFLSSGSKRKARYRFFNPLALPRNLNTKDYCPIDSVPLGLLDIAVFSQVLQTLASWLGFMAVGQLFRFAQRDYGVGLENCRTV
jgi:hypothetical protein